MTSQLRTPAPFDAGEFLPAYRSVVPELAESSLPARVFVPGESAPWLSNERLNTLESLAEHGSLFPARELMNGRSLYGEFRRPHEWHAKGLKMKGAGGLQYDAEEQHWICRPPAPDTAYGRPQLHFALDEALKIRVIEGRQRALRSMTEIAANNEFACQNRLADEGLGYPGLATGGFLSAADGNPERNFLNERTGAVFIAHNPDAVRLTKVMLFVAIQERRGVSYGLPQVDGGTLVRQLPDVVIQDYIELSSRTAALKIRAALDAGVIRHAAQPDNFWYDSANDRIYISDTDSCLIAQNMDPRYRGPQLLRDLASDINHSITNLGYFAYTDYYLRGIENGDFKPFHAFLGSYFSGHVERDEIDNQAQRLHKAYVDFLSTEKDILDKLAGMLRNGLLTGAFVTPEIVIRETWQHTHVPFIAEALSAGYALMRQSSLFRRGFTLPAADESLLAEQFRSGVAQFKKAQAAANRGA